MESTYEKAYKVLVHINDNMIPLIDETYEHDYKDITKLIQKHECLNRSRSITNIAIQCLNGGYESEEFRNKNIASYLNDLKQQGSYLDRESDSLGVMLANYKDLYVKNRTNIAQDNVDLLNELKLGVSNGDDLFNQAASLGNKIKDFVENELYKAHEEFVERMKTLGHKYCDTIESYYTSIKKQDSNLLPSLRNTTWSSLEF
ncbi:MAG: hypothetical protein GQ570_09430 [Helicobacteraceae bacterium]|nr:hypothetical protein [Helicobacteraceae bacterium]